MKIVWDVIVDLLDNNVLMVACFSWTIAQILKVIINAIVNKEFSWSRLFGDGGMPSGHSATVTSAAIVCGWCYGFASVEFGIAIVLAIIVMHDASGVRLEVGKQAVITKEIAEVINNLFDHKLDSDIKTEKLKELVGHTPLQVAIGSVLGLTVAIVFCAVCGIGYMDGSKEWLKDMLEHVAQ